MAVAVSGGSIAEVGPARLLRRRYPEAERIHLGDAIILPGLVNAHQHGRGLSQIQLGYPDDALEPWIARRRARSAPDTRSLTRLACLEMLANGVTATLHANYSYGSGAYEAELRGSIRAYEETGIRATICVGFADRGGLVYPPADEAAFSSGLSEQARALLASARSAYLPLDETLDLMARLLSQYAGHPTLSFAYGPAGPQWVSDEAWRVLSRDAAERGIGIHFHLLESPAQAACARSLYPGGVLSHLERLGVFSAPASAAHFTHAAPGDVADAVRLGLVVVSNPGSNLRLHNGAPALAAWRQAGIHIALGTDNCALDDNEDYLAELRLADLLSRERAEDADARAHWLLQTATASGAAAAFMANIGVDAGNRADLIAINLKTIRGAYLDQDIPLLPAVMARGSGRDIVLTMVEGRILYRNGASTAGDLEEAQNAAREAASAARTAGPQAPGAAEELAGKLRAHYAEAMP